MYVCRFVAAHCEVRAAIIAKEFIVYDICFCLQYHIV